jgi:hypothetical protein
LTNSDQSSPKVAFLLGEGRSGSTVLSRILGTRPSWFALGELSHIWRWSLISGGQCTCGRVLSTCPVWKEVLQCAFSQPSLRDVSGGLAADSRHTWRVMFEWQADALHAARRFLVWYPRSLRIPNRARVAIGRYNIVLSALYRAASDVMGARVLVDSSKTYTHAALLERTDGIDPYFVHLIRDPRAVAYSWTRKKSQPVAGGVKALPKRSSVAASRFWVEYNLAAATLVRRNEQSSLVVRYEDFIADPDGQIQAIAQKLQEALPSAEPSTSVGENHMVWGNPGRFAFTGKLEEDRSWQQRLPKTDRFIVTLLTRPIARKYGYM